MFLYNACSIQSVELVTALYTSPPDRPVLSDTNSASLGSILATRREIFLRCRRVVINSVEKQVVLVRNVNTRNESSDHRVLTGNR